MIFGQTLRMAALIGAAIPLTALNSQAGIVLVTGAGADVAGITGVRDGFRTSLGGGTVAGANGLFADATGQRREINWMAFQMVSRHPTTCRPTSST